nr:adenine phosphoribosyltransferase [Clostridia bacterium]
MNEFLTVDIKGFKADLPILALPSGVKIAFFNLHGAPAMTEHCGKELAKLAKGAEVVITAESKGLQLAHVVARELNHPFYAVARKAKKLYMQDGISVSYGSSITTGKAQELYLSKHDVDIIRGKKVAIIDDVVSTGESLKGLEDLVLKAGGIIYKKLFVLAEGNAKDRQDIDYLATIPLL